MTTVLRRALAGLATGLAALVAACAPVAPPAVPESVVPPAAPALAGRLPLASGVLEVQVFRDGPLARLGHDHLIASDALAGWAAAAGGRVRFRVELPLESLVVDDPARRAVAGGGFAAPVPDADRAATRRNLLGPAVLDAATQPRLVAEGEASWPLPAAAEVTLGVGLGGGRRELRAPVTVEADGSGWRVQSAFVVSHAALGLTPFSVALGALRVRDDIHVRLDLRFQAAGAGS